MINGLEGIPGSGKSYEAVAYHVLPQLKQGRKVITNLPLLVDMFAAIDPAYVDLIELRHRPGKVLGVWDADGVDENGNGEAFKLWKDEERQNVVPVSSDATAFGTVWCYYSTWKHPETGQGPLFIVDECHVPLPATGTSKEVVEWYKLHRHFNVDVLLMTQSFRDTNQPIARIIGMLITCRKADVLGKKDSYIRKVKSGYRGAVISTEIRPYKPEYFKLYKSHTQGNSVAESAAGDVAPFIVKFKRFTWAFWALTVVVLVWAFWPSSPAPSGSKSVRAVPVGDPVKPAIAAGVVLPVRTDVALLPEAAASVDAGPPEPYASKGLHLTGRIQMGSLVVYTFVVSMGGQRIASIDSRDLAAAGYKWEPLTDCAGTLRWRTKATAVTCDAPVMSQGSTDKPVVLEVPAGGGAPVGSSVRSIPLPPARAANADQISIGDVVAQARAGSLP
ncbi:zonular occludens toxin domain-containing protein [Paracidovorax citrulli]|uniref:zonular occludens toxin domain-containing protein n=1 Tax=Paracidovorax citrulli TaxID=80869 RepID=UPI0003073B68|nr:zonular occludens toxin domain-containing protein [Paracidovorax citrulli]UEG48108.1 zonular occludens toxin [Paracidovorax citrulli]UMT96633.1 zonular occludens toxin [Paracidovorax citrulli]